MALCVGGGPARAADRPLVLALSIDGVAQDDPVLARDRDDGLWIATGDVPVLDRWADPSGQIALDRVPRLVYRLDRAAQALAITLPPAAQARPAITGARGPPPEVTPNGWGGYLNYDGVATAVQGHAALDAQVDAHVFSPHFVAYTGMLLRAGHAAFGRSGLIRLDSGITLPDLRRDRRWTFGDFIGGGTSVSRPVRMGGIQLSTDFGLRPDLVTFPVPDIAAQAAVPSAVDLVTNTAQRDARPATPGAFANGGATVATGLNSVSVATRDALGRDTVQTVSFYTSRALLLPGLSATSLDIGFVRTGYGSTDDRYRRFAAAGTYRRGLSPTLTIESHGELARGITSVSGGATVGLGDAGALYVAGGASRGRVFDHQGGVQIALGWERLARPVSMSARYVRSSAGFADIAALYATPVRRSSLVANVGFDLARLGTLSLAVVRLGPGRQTLTRAGFGPIDQPYFQRIENGTRMRRLPALTLANATFAVPVARRFSFVANVTRVIGEAHSVSASAGLLMLFGSHTSAQAGIERRPEGTSGRLAFSRPAIVPGDTGFRADVASGALARQAAQIEYVASTGRYQAAVERVGGITAVRAATQGALVLVPGGMFRADRIDGSFALVDTNGEARVPVFRENRAVGATDRRGFLIVTGLLPYQANRISLNPEALDLDVSVTASERLLRPREQSGVSVDFGIRREHSVVVRLVDESGQPIPAGARASLNGQPPVPVGLDGEVYLAGPAASNRLVATTGQDERCEARFDDPWHRAGQGVPVRLLCAPIEGKPDRMPTNALTARAALP